MCLFPNWELNLYMYPYFVVGFLFAKYKDKIPKTVINIKYCFIFVFPIMLLFYQKKHYIYTSGIISSDNILELITIDGYRWAIGFTGSVFVLTIIELLYRFMFVKKPALTKPIECLGRKSLQMYCISVSVLSFWLPVLYEKVLGNNIFASNIMIYNFVFTPLVAVIFAILIYYIVKLFEKIRVSKVLFGR